MPNFMAYKRLIDELVDISKTEVTARRIGSHGHGERMNDDDFPLNEEESARKNFVLGLTLDQRELITKMLEDARVSAIHDVARYLEWALSCDDMEIRWRNEIVPSSPFVSMHFDFIARCEGDPWPVENSTR
jgi:hypothetical protein